MTPPFFQTWTPLAYASTFLVVGQFDKGFIADKINVCHFSLYIRLEYASIRRLIPHIFV